MQTLPSALTIAEIVVQKSRFIAWACRVENAEQVQQVLKSARQKFPAATHYCYAYRLTNAQKCSDDGEPQGTAGMPLLKVLERRGLEQALVVVIRYFGGIKLGTGGLARAYGQAAESVLAMAPRVDLRECAIFQAVLPYPQAADLTQLLAGGQILNENFGAQVEVMVAVPVAEAGGWAEQVRGRAPMVQLVTQPNKMIEWHI